MTEKRKGLPAAETEKQKSLPPAEQPGKGLPQVGSPENSIVIGGRLVEIKPTRLRYQRNRTAAFYKIWNSIRWRTCWPWKRARSATTGTATRRSWTG